MTHNQSSNLIVILYLDSHLHSIFVDMDMTGMVDMDLIMIVRSGSYEGTRLSMRYDSACSLDDLNGFLQRKFPKKLVRIHVPDDTPLSICSHSLFTVRKNLIADVFPFPQQVGLAILEHGSLIHVRVKGMGSEKLLCLHKTDTVQLLKTISLQDEGSNINDEDIKIAIEGHWGDIDEDLTLAEAGILNMTCLHINIVLKECKENKRSTVNVPDEDQIRTKKSSGKSRDFSLLRHGLSIEGICRNKQCRAHIEPVICYHGFGLFLFHNLRNQCPACKSNVRINNFIFVSCFHRIQGQILKGAPLSQVVNWTKVRNAYRIWDPKKAAVNEWAVMEFSTRPLNLSMIVDGNMNVKDAPIDHTCAVCMGKMRIGDNLHMLTCCHSFHSVCFSKWSVVKVALKTGQTCPICLKSE